MVPGGGHTAQGHPFLGLKQQLEIAFFGQKIFQTDGQQAVGVGMPPADAERVAGGVGEDIVAFAVGEVAVGEEQSSAELRRLD